jgi:hypothetical protein
LCWLWSLNWISWLATCRSWCSSRNALNHRGTEIKWMAIVYHTKIVPEQDIYSKVRSLPTSKMSRTCTLLQILLSIIPKNS